MRIATILLLTLTTATAAYSQDFPNKPIRIFAGSVGGGGDFITRLIAPGMTMSLGQSVVVENRGGGSLISGEIVAKAPADGYTLITASNSLWTAPLLAPAPYDTIKDFAPITLISNSPQVLVVHPSLPVKTVKELVALAKAKPGELNYAITNRGGAAHLAGELFKALAGVNIVAVPYSTNAATLNAMLGGEVKIAFDSTSVLMPNVQAGKLRALAVTTAQPSTLVPGLPTVAASGLPGFESTQVNGMFAPAKTPAAIVTRLNQEAVRALNQPEVKEKLFSTGVEVVASPPDTLATAVKGEITRMSKVIKDAGIKSD